MLVDFIKSRLRSRHSPHLIEGIHVEGQVVELALVVGDRRVGVAVELHDGVDEVPHLLAVRVEDMGTIFMDIDSFDGLAIDIAAQIGAFVNH